MAIFKKTGEKQVGTIDFSDGTQKRFICYCPKCRRKILWTYFEIQYIVRHLEKINLIPHRRGIIGRLKGIIGWGFNLKIKIVDGRDNKNFSPVKH